MIESRGRSVFFLGEGGSGGYECCFSGKGRLAALVVPVAKGREAVFIKRGKGKELTVLKVWNKGRRVTVLKGGKMWASAVCRERR